MSWDQHLAALTESGHVHHGAIVGLDGTPWVSSPNFDTQAAKWVDSLVQGGDISKLQAGGLMLNGEKYVYVRTVTDDDDQDYGVVLKKGSGGAVIVRANTCFVVAQFNEGYAQDPLADACRLRDWLVESNY
eukprot:TRINITY_DN3307_c0_g2_i1.p1 TRINITY_DN3307_c0_g2~~TRINITY_DN3307_c0_g2_i1.p1  ORF type:complete len:131 (+),score=23.64 TRINITY_DN3307_c0_g2_i1:104-496(+)